jgi:hypothetical protein
MLPLLVAPELADASVVLMFVWVYVPGFMLAAVNAPTNLHLALVRTTL